MKAVLNVPCQWWKNVTVVSQYVQRHGQWTVDTPSPVNLSIILLGQLRSGGRPVPIGSPERPEAITPAPPCYRPG